MKSIQWAAGLIDAEGSFYLTYTTRGARVANFSIYMTDLLPIQHMSKLFDLPIIKKKPSGKAKKLAYGIRARCVSEVMRIINMIEPYLVTKRNSSDLLKEICSIIQQHIDDPLYRYSESDLASLYDLESSLCRINKGVPNYCGNPNFSWDWLSGMTDGDGSVYLSKCTRNGKSFHRLEYKICLKDRYTIDYLNKQFKRDNSNKPFQDKRPNRNLNYSFRLVSSQAADVISRLAGRTVIKEKQISLGLEMNDIRSTRSTGRLSDRVDEIVLEMKSLNKN